MHACSITHNQPFQAFGHVDVLFHDTLRNPLLKQIMETSTNSLGKCMPTICSSTRHWILSRDSLWHFHQLLFLLRHRHIGDLFHDSRRVALLGRRRSAPNRTRGTKHWQTCPLQVSQPRAQNFASPTNVDVHYCFSLCDFHTSGDTAPLFQNQKSQLQIGELMNSCTAVPD